MIVLLAQAQAPHVLSAGEVVAIAMLVFIGMMALVIFLLWLIGF